MKINTIAFIVTALILPSVTHATSWFDVREQYNTYTNQNQNKLGFGHIFDDGSGVLISNLNSTGEHLDRYYSSFQEYEGWYNIKLNDKVSMAPGGLVDVSATGTTQAPYFGATYTLDKQLSIGGRYRYNHQSGVTTNTLGDLKHNDTHQLDMFISYQVTPKLWMQINPEYFMNTNDFKSTNGKSSHWEPSLIARYRFNQQWMGYTEATWLDKAADNSNIMRYRVGVRYFL